jgi:hypothetical protein
LFIETVRPVQRDAGAWRPGRGAYIVQTMENREGIAYLLYFTVFSRRKQELFAGESEEMGDRRADSGSRVKTACKKPPDLVF